MSDEPIYTGWLQAQFSGDVDRAKTFMHEARRVLGGMLSSHGINDKLAAGEPSGFAKTYRQYPDGTRVTAWHNNGQNVVRVDTPPIKVTREEREHETPKGTDWQGEGKRHATGEGHTPHGVDVPHLKTSRSEEEEEEEKESNGFYMWVGLRSITPNVPHYVVDGCIIEPKVEGRVRGVIDANEFFGVSFIELNDDGTFDGRYGQSSFNEAVNEDFTSYSQAAFNNYPGLQYGDHNTTIYFGKHRFLASANGLICQSHDFVSTHAEGLRNVVDEGEEEYMQYDPLSKSQDGSDRPDVGDRDAPGNLFLYPTPLPWSYVNPTPPLRNWDVTWELDPDPYTFPGDTREWKTTIIKALENNHGMAKSETKVLPGLYMLTVNAAGSYPQLTSRRAGFPIPTSQLPEDNILSRRSDHSDYDAYMYRTSGIRNVGIEIEVRLNKGSELNVYRFQTVIDHADNRGYTTSPFGDGFEFDACAAEGGPNPMGPNFMQTPIAIDVTGGIAGWADDFKGATVAPIFGGGQYALPGDPRKRLMLCMHGGYFASQPGDEAWAEFAGYAAFRALEDATSGMYGSMLFNEFSEEALAGIFAGGDRHKVNVLDCVSGELSVYDLINNPGDYDPPFITDENGNTVNSPYSPYMEWYYPYRVLIKAQCLNSLGVVVMADKDGWVLQTGQTRGGAWGNYPGDPDPPDCCT